ncbi:hypothetical protein ACHAW5_009919 [Stephanodiscus triporus]|uniref:Uncharacterized protein n=1 Tax=Stephanodiscus triporus TaxID=2934178 RepID=A0ABD3QLR5_9STRA
MASSKQVDSYSYAPVAVPIYADDENPLAERFIEVAPNVETVSPDAQPYLEVVAPATLPEGYTFEAESNGHAFTVRVPVGGVERGQKFSVPFLPGSNGYSGSAMPRASVPVGHWKDMCCDCFRLGVIHPVVWNAWFCPFILLGQVMHRLKLTWLGNEGHPAQSAATFRILVMITAVHLISNQTLKFLVFAYIAFSGGDASDIETAQCLANARLVLNLAFGIFFVVLLTRTRGRIRSKYGIPEQRCSGCEDCCQSFWCYCCTLSQMARHTADYENYPALCCSETGLSPNAPSIV